jgi:hypothetical protein
VLALHNNRNIFVVLIFTLATILAIPVVNSVSAQDYPTQTSMPNSPQMQMVSGKYTNPDSGLVIVLPSGWNGFEMKTVNGTMVSASMAPSSSGGIQSTAMMVSMMDKSKIKAPPSALPPVNPNQKEQCKQDSTGPVTINGMNGVQYIMSCTGDVSTKMKLITFQTDKYYISTIFVDNATSYDTNVATFDSSVNTLQIPNTTGAPSAPQSSQPAVTTQNMTVTQSNQTAGTAQNMTSNAPVPEFPLAAVGAITALMMGMAIFATKRLQLFRI